MAWTIVVTPEGRNPGPIRKAAAEVGATDRDATQGVNQGGMVIYLADGATRHEVSRVAFVRRNSKNPKVKFDAQLDAELKKARESLAVLNAAQESAGELQ